MPELMISRRQRFLGGIRDTVPMLIGAAPFGLIFGALAVTSAGLSVWGAMGFSLLVFAGSAQFVAAGLLAQGAGIPVIVLTTFVVNLRHALYGASLALFMMHLPRRWLAPLAFWLTDETYAVVIGTWNDPGDRGPFKEWYQLGSSVAMYLNWQCWTLTGVIAGNQFQQATDWGLDFAMVVTFIGIVVPMVVNRAMLVCAVVAGGVGVLCHGLPHNLGLIVAALAAMGAGYAVETLSAGPTPAEETP